MNKWKGSLGAKFAAWVGITISGVIFLASVAGAVGIWEMGIYDYATEEAWRTELYERAANNYAIRALDNLGVPMEDKWNDTSFCYGIIKAESIEGLDFNDESIYVESNFTEKVDADKLHKLCYQVGDDSYFSYSGTIYGGAYTGSRSETYVTDVMIYQVIYNTDDGTFYYETGSGYYPIREVEIGYPSMDSTTIYHYVYDFETKTYQNQTYTQVESDSEFAIVEQAEGSELIDTLEQEYLTFDMLDAAGFACEDWEYLILDGKQYSGENDGIRFVNAEYMTEQEIANETAYEFVPSEDWSRLRVTHNTAEERETYWVVVEMPEHVEDHVELRWSRDLFVQANTLASVGYGMRYAIYAVLFLSLGVSVAFFVFLMSAAGHRNDREGIVRTWLDKMPFDVYLGFAFLAEAMLAYLVIDSSYYIDGIPVLILMAFWIVCMCWIALLTFLTFAVRVKAGKWWQSTVVWMVGYLLFDVARTILTNMGLLWKAIIAIGALSFVEFMVVSWDGIGRITMFWMLEKVILVPLLLLAIVQMQKLKAGAKRMAEGDLQHNIDTRRMFWEFQAHGEALNSISGGMSLAVDERMKSERFKTELITNVSHDIKTPLTSIINYVDLLEKEDLQNEKAVEYLEVLERQSARLKKLIEDLMEASKASTGNLAVHLEELEAGVSLVQIVGEFEEKMQRNELELVISKPDESIYIQADSRHFWRVVDNLMNNICKYAQGGTRVYINLEKVDDTAIFTFKNTSKYALNISSEELMERFVRGDSSRNTEGSGLGLSIAKSLMELMDGVCELYVDGDLFKVVLKLPCIKLGK